MKTATQSRRRSGVMLVECLVYIAVFGILTAIGFASYYLCWNQSKAVVYATDSITAALHAGERWRADVRHATGAIRVEESAGGQTLKIPGAGGTTIYRFAGGELRRETSVPPRSEVALSRVLTSRMNVEPRGGVTGCRWELQLVQRRPETQLPLLFTFEAAPTKP
jgi:Tfp pilus assembly protein FimT